MTHEFEANAKESEKGCEGVMRRPQPLAITECEGVRRSNLLLYKIRKPSYRAMWWGVYFECIGAIQYELALRTFAPLRTVRK